MAGEKSTDGQGTQTVQRAGNLILGPEEARAKPGPTVAEVLAGVKERLAAGQSPLEGIQNTDPEGQAPASHGPAAAAAADAPPATAEGEKAADDLPPLPDGFVRADDGSIRRADGTFPSAEELAAIQAETPPEEATGTDKPPEGQEDTGDEPLVVKLPAREDGQPDEEWEVGDPELAQSINRLRNGYMRGEELKRQMADVQTQRDELDFVLDGMRLDPEGFLLERVTEPEVRKRVALQLLTDPDIFKHVMEEFGSIEDDDVALDAKRSKLRLERLEKRDQVREQAQRDRDMRQQVRDITQTIDNFAAELDDGQRKNFQRLAARELADHIREKRIESIQIDEIPVILHQRGILQLFGLKPEALGSRNGSRAESAEPTGAPQPKKAPAPAKAAAAGKEPVNARKVGEQFKAAREKRESAAAVAPPGVGAAPSRLNPPEGQGVRDRIKWFRKESGITK